MCIERVLKTYAAGPDGKSKISIGEAIICFDCGFVGLPVDSETKLTPRCRSCSSKEQINFISFIQPDGSIIPWIELELQCPDTV